MKRQRILTVAFRQIQINRGRSLLASIALAIGIAAVMVMVAWGNGAKRETIKQMEAMGTNLLTINPGEISNVILRKDSTDSIRSLRLRVCDEIKNGCSLARELVRSVCGTVK